MEQKQKPLKMIDIKTIIQFGAKRKVEFQIPFYFKQNKDVKVEIRALSNYEYSIIDLDMYSEIENQDVIDHIFNKEDKVDEDEKASIYDKEQTKIEKQGNKEIITFTPKIDELTPETELNEEDEVSYVEVLKAFLYRNVLISYNAMKDYIPDLTIEQVKEIGGIDEIAHKVNELSGRTDSVQDGIEFFRDAQDEPGPAISAEKGS